MKIELRFLITSAIVIMFCVCYGQTTQTANSNQTLVVKCELSHVNSRLSHAYYFILEKEDTVNFINNHEFIDGLSCDTTFQSKRSIVKRLYKLRKLASAYSLDPTTQLNISIVTCELEYMVLPCATEQVTSFELSNYKKGADIVVTRISNIKRADINASLLCSILSSFNSRE